MKIGKILFIGNDEKLLVFLREELVFKKGYNLIVANNAGNATDIFKDGTFDLVITKFDKSNLEAVNLIKELKKIDSECIIIVVVDVPDTDAPQDLLRLGVYEIFSKPINLERLDFVTKKGVELHSLLISNRKFINSLEGQNLSLQKQNILLAKRIEESTKNLTRLYEDLRSTYMLTIKALANAIDKRDHYTHSHSENVAKYAKAIAEEMHLSLKDINMIGEACELHDLGKIGVQDSVLSKDTQLSQEEWEQIKLHSLKGAQILEPLSFLSSVVELVRQHHEHWDGSGYPDGHKGEEILLGARIIHLADAYDAMTSARSYRKVPLTKSEAIEEIRKNSGQQFDPKVVEAFLRIINNL
jgi:putative nucleotidyltransferase with HDIG domain